jgi:hypothetical protein
MKGVEIKEPFQLIKQHIGDRRLTVDDMRCGLASNPPRDSQVSGKKRKVDNESRKL